ncbi:MAG: hypothetical protein M3N47_03020 [Chloroflexota bacterium]|nr:hypothetical protein [Chloroflexota bacterium]
MTIEAKWNSPLQQRQRERDALLRRIEAGLHADQRVVAVWLAGSLGRGDADALSDIDLWIVVGDDAMGAIGASPGRFVSGIVAPCLVIDVPRNAPPNGAYLFTHIPGDTGAHQVDWYWQSVTYAARPATTKLLFERQPVPLEAAPAPLDHDALVAQLSVAHAEFWAVVHIATKAIARGDYRAVHRNVEYLERFTRTLRWLIDHGTSPTFDVLRKTIRDAPLPTTASDQLQLLDTFVAQVEAMEPELVRHNVPASAVAKVQVLRWVNLVRVVSD